MKTTLTILGTHCRACKLLIEDVCKEQPGVTACSVDFETGKTDIEHAEVLDLTALTKEIESLGGYRVTLKN